MTKKQKRNLIRIILSSVLMIVFLMIPLSGIIRFVLFMIPYLIIGYDILIKAGKGIINLQPFDECFLMSLATVGAMAIAVTTDGDYIEAISVMLFYQIGEWFQSYAVGKSRKNITELMDIRPDYANVEIDGKIEKIDPDEVEIGTIITVQPGEKIPIDGLIIEGSSCLNTSALTGESLPRDVSVGDEVISGCINQSGVLKIKTTKDFESSTVSKILELVENASSRKSRSENFITRFARIYTPFVVFSAAALAVIPPLVNTILSKDALWFQWIYRALTFLVISCPCALVISVPLSFFAGIGGASREGVLVKGSNYFEMLSKTKTIVFDKTGTLTKGVFEVVRTVPNEISEHELLTLAAAAEQYSTHPIALSIKKAAGNTEDGSNISEVEELAGHGAKAKVNGNVILAGNEKLMQKSGISIEKSSDEGTVVYVAKDQQYMGRIIISDVVKPTSAEALLSLKKCGIKRTVMLTGDNSAAAEKAAAELGIDEVYSELLPGDKVAKTDELIKQNSKGMTLAFVGDGINDAPVLARADVGISMGALGSDAAIEASDIVLMDDDPMKISKAIRIANKCIRIVHENIWFSIGVKLICLILGALGIANMWAAIFADVGVMVIAVLNSIRCLRVKNL